MVNTSFSSPHEAVRFSWIFLKGAVPDSFFGEVGLLQIGSFFLNKKGAYVNDSCHNLQKHIHFKAI